MKYAKMRITGGLRDPSIDSMVKKAFLSKGYLKSELQDEQ